MNPDIQRVFNLQQAHKKELQHSTVKQRREKLRHLAEVISAYEDAICDALWHDLRKSKVETVLSETAFISSEIKHALDNLEHWVKPKRVPNTSATLFTRSEIVKEPKGNSLIIAPWNYPFNLLFSPLVSAIAAGNTAILKPSELTPSVASLISKMASTEFDVREIAAFTGGPEVSQELLSLPFDHIFFTGSPKIGKEVMTAAAKNLSSVTLELGGKSPAIVDASADLDKAAAKIVWGKFLNAGQTCIAPDYVLVAQQHEAELIRLIKHYIKKYYYPEGTLNKNDYVRIVNKKHLERLAGLVKNATSMGARIEFGDEIDPTDLSFPPTVISRVLPAMDLMQEEIFGPILPVLTFGHIDEAVAIIRSQPKPLALYCFARKKQVIDHVIRSTSSGGVTVNDTLIHITNPSLPFGGVNNSGTGASHGHAGFLEFTHSRSVVYQNRMIDFNSLAYPPYEKKTRWLNWLRKMI